MLPFGYKLLCLSIFLATSFLFLPTSTLEHQSTPNKEEREGEETFFASNSTSKNQMFDLLLTKFSSPSSKAFDSSQMRDALPPPSTYSLLAGGPVYSSIPLSPCDSYGLPPPYRCPCQPAPSLPPPRPPPMCMCPLPRPCPPPLMCPPLPMCPPPPLPSPPPPCRCFVPPMPSCPIPPPPPLPVPRPPQILMPQNDCCCNCQGGCRVKYANVGAFKAHGTRIRGFGENSNARCNSAALQRIIVESISEEIDTAKRIIQQKAQETYDSKSFNVVCGKGEFSFVVHTELFCQESLQRGAERITCYAFSV